MMRCAALMSLFVVSGCGVSIPDFRPSPGLSPAPLPPVVAPQSSKDRFIAATTANGCAVTSTNSTIIMQEAVLSREDLARIMTELRSEGRGQIAADGTSFELTTGICA